MDEMNPTPFLSIVIPTYNRAAFLDHSFEAHVPLARLHNIQIFVSDNASTDNTKEVVDKWKNEYPLISYYCNETNLGPDDNFERALKYPDTEYVWLLGDTYRIPDGGIEYILDIVKGKKKYSAIVFNLGGFIKIDAIGSKDYTDQNALLGDLGALMTCLSCLVYCRKLIENANFSRYRHSYFIQAGIIFEAIASRPFAVHWVQSLSINSLTHPSLIKSNWSYTNDVLDIACKRWSNFIFSLPVSYDPEIKLNCIMAFGKISRLFLFKGLLNLRRLNLLNLRAYKQYSRFFSLTVDYPKTIVFAVSMMPRSIIKSLGIIVVLFSKEQRLAKIRRIVRNVA